MSRLEEGLTGFVVRENRQYDDDLRPLFDRGVAALKAGKYATAITSFESVIKKAPLLSAPYVNLAIAQIRRGKDTLAEQPLQKALELVAGHPLASHEYGLLLRRAGRFAEARAVYEEALERFPEYYPLRKNLGILCDIYMDDTKCAARQYRKFLEAQPENEQVRLWLVELNSRRGR